LFSWKRWYLKYATQDFYEMQFPELVYFQHKLHIPDQVEYDNMSYMAMYDTGVAERVRISNATSGFFTLTDIEIPWKARMEHYMPNFSFNARMSLFVEQKTSTNQILQPEAGNPAGAVAPTNMTNMWVVAHGVHMPREKRELIIGLTRRVPDPKMGFPGGIYFEWNYYEYQIYNIAQGITDFQLFTIDNFKFPAKYTLIVCRKHSTVFGQGDAGGNNEYLDFIPIDQWKIYAYDKNLTPDYVWDYNQYHIMPKFFQLNEPQLVANAHSYCLNPNDNKSVTGFQTFKDFDKPKIYLKARDFTDNYDVFMINKVFNSSHLYDGEIYKPLR